MVAPAQLPLGRLQVKWQLMVASCHRRIGAYPQAKALYEEIHKKYPRQRRVYVPCQGWEGQGCIRREGASGAG